MPSLITTHANQRAHERLGFRGRALERTAAKALESGVRMAATSGSLHRWLDTKLHVNTILRIHGEHLFVFGSKEPHVLITIYPIPRELRPAARRAASLYAPQ